MEIDSRPICFFKTIYLLYSAIVMRLYYALDFFLII